MTDREQLSGSLFSAHWIVLSIRLSLGQVIISLSLSLSLYGLQAIS